jgi:hypothetical protein
MRRRFVLDSEGPPPVVEAMAAQGRWAIVEGDLREDLDPETVAESIVSAIRSAVAI